MPAAKYIGNPQFRVHTQQGTLLRAVQGRMLQGARYRVEADIGVAPHAAYIIKGTRIMLGRDVIWSTAEAKGTTKELAKVAVAMLGKALRSQAVIRFAETPDGSRRLTILAMEKAGIDMHAAARMTAGAMGATFLGLVRHNMGLTDHTLGDLARLRHPYARRQGSIRIH